LQLEVLLIIVVFGGILAIFLYKYLLQSPEAASPSQSATESEEQLLEPLAERVYKLFEKVELLDKNFSDLESYLQQKVEIWKKKEKAKGSTQ